MYFEFITCLLTLPIIYIGMWLSVDCIPSKRKCITRMLLCTFVNITIYMFITYNFKNNPIVSEYSPLLSLIPGLICFMSICKELYFEFYFIFFTHSIIAALLNVESFILAEMLFSSNQWLQLLIRLIMQLVLLYFIYKYFSKGYKFMYRNRTLSNLWLLVYEIVIIFIWQLYASSKTRLIDISNSVLVPYLTYIDRGDLDYLFVLILTMILGLLYIGFVFYKDSKRHNYLIYSNVVKVKNEHLLQQINEYNEKESELRVIRHNVKHKANIIYGLLNDNKIEDAKRLLRDADYILDKTKVDKYCDNVTINTTLSVYLDKCRKADIDVITNFKIPSLSHSIEDDVSMMLANAIDNAYNANIKLDVKDRFIKLVFIKNRVNILVEVSNPFDGNIILDDSGNPTSRNDEHGFGTISIRTFSKKHKGSYDYSILDNIFKLRVMFNDE
ncbi:MAG: GHKL domain-containing protein [Erysipelotrichaceae bacterium]